MLAEFPTVFECFPVVYWLRGYTVGGQWHLANSLSLAGVRESLAHLSETDLQHLLPASRAAAPPFSSCCLQPG